MRVVVIGAGPAGLLFSLLAKRRFPSWQIEVAEQNPPEATFGFGVVFSQGALAFLERGTLPSCTASSARAWSAGRCSASCTATSRLSIDGNGFSAISRLALNRFFVRRFVK